MSVNAYNMPTGVQIPPATDFRQNQTASSRYRFRRILGEGSSAQTAFAMATNSTTDVNFRFGAGYVINLAKTRLRITEQIQASTTSKQRWVRALPPIAAMRLQTSSGVILFDVQNFDAYMNITYPFWQRRSKARKMSTMVVPQWRDGRGIGAPSFMGNTSGNPSGITIPAAGAALATGTSAAASSNNLTASAAIMEPGGPFVVPGIQVSSSTASVSTFTLTEAGPGTGNGRIGGNVPSFTPTLGSAFHPSPVLNPGLPRQYIPTITSGATGVLTSTNYMQWDVPLSDLLPHTVCAALQDLYFGTDLLLTVSFQMATKRMWDGSICLTNATGTAITVAGPDYVPAPAVGHTDIADVSVLTNCSYSTDLQLATQDNLDLVNSVKQEIASKGIRIPVQQPFLSIEAVTQDSSAVLAYSRTLRLNVARGAALLKAYSGIMFSKTSASNAPMLNREFYNVPSALSSIVLGND